jgi:protein tyrosine phosphatase (PTP) superfamily phosphohydrolase (DUF442 family)
VTNYRTGAENMTYGLEEIKAFRGISSRLGTAGQPTKSQFPLIKTAGYEVVINLAVPTSTGAIPEEPEIWKSLGLEYLAIPVDWEQPTLKDLQQFFAVIKQHSDRQIFVHCALNMRVSVFVYLYRVLCLGVEREVAIEDLQKIWIPNETWSAFIESALMNQP